MNGTNDNSYPRPPAYSQSPNLQYHDPYKTRPAIVLNGFSQNQYAWNGVPNAARPAIVYQPSPHNVNQPQFTKVIILSCFVAVCCGVLFGGIAFILAVVGRSKASKGNSKEAKSLMIASYVLSTIGMIAGITCIAVIQMYNRYDYRYYG